MRSRAVRPFVQVLASGVLAVAAGAALAGCGAGGGLVSDGPTPAAAGPVRLWPELPPASDPPVDYGETDTERVPGIAVRDADVRTVDPVAVLRAEAKARPDTFAGPDGDHEETARAVLACGSAPAACPVLRAYRHDLTGDGRDELIAGVRLPGQQVAVRVYLAEDGGLTRVMSAVEQVVSVELTGRDLIVRAASAGIPGYEYRTVWSWDARQHAVLPARDEIVPLRPRPAPSRSGATPEPVS